MAKRMDFKQGAYKEAVKFFQDKLKVLPTKKWDDIKGAMHTRAFTVAGCMQEDILRDFRSAVNAAISKGETLQDFRDRFYTIANKWRAADPSFDEKMEKPKYGAWRSKVIYQTNMLTCAAAGQERQARSMPDVFTHAKYICQMLPGSREEHKAWNGIVLPVNDPWWQKHSPPNGFGCLCEKEFISKYEMDRGDEKETVRTKDNELSPNDTTNIGKNWDYSIGDADMGVSGVSWEKYEDIPQSGIWQPSSFELPKNYKPIPMPKYNKQVDNVKDFCSNFDSVLKDTFAGRKDTRFFKGGMVLEKEINGIKYPLIIEYNEFAKHLMQHPERSKFINMFAATLSNPTDFRFSFQQQPNRREVSLNAIFYGIFNEAKGTKNKNIVFVFRAYKHKLTAWTAYRDDGKKIKLEGKSFM
jgi:hypothetical protein